MLNDLAQNLFATIDGLPPVAAFLAIVAATFVLEDVAIIAAGLLASTGMLNPALGGAALLAGIVLGDFGLFAIGRAAASTPGLRKYVDTKLAHSLRNAGTQRIFSVVFSTRFVPGMRLPTYSGLGYVGAPFWRFAVAVLCAVSLWTIALYWIVLQLGSNVLAAAGAWKWAVIAAIIAVVIIAERAFIKRRRARG